MVLYLPNLKISFHPFCSLQIYIKYYIILQIQKKCPINLIYIFSFALSSKFYIHIPTRHKHLLDSKRHVYIKKLLCALYTVSQFNIIQQIVYASRNYTQLYSIIHSIHFAFTTSLHTLTLLLVREVM